MDSPWKDSNVIAWTQVLLASYRQRLGRALFEPTPDASPDAIARALYEAPFVIVSHGTQADPILNYGNRTAIALWETTWDDITQMPSRLTAEQPNREVRQQMLDRVQRDGYIDDYRGVRISATGRRFEIDDAVVWNLSDADDKFCGQAATFNRWRFLK
ncbi:MAG: MEKHLA domain-containing protein [Geitlerinemataceae cyanobacterium]